MGAPAPHQSMGSPSPTASPTSVYGEPQPHIELLPHSAPHSRAPQPHRSPSPPPPHGAAPLWGLHGTRWGRIPPHIHRGRGAARPCGGLWGLMGIYGALWGSDRLYGAAPQLLTAPHGVGGLRSTETRGAERHRKGRSHGADTAKRRGEKRNRAARAASATIETGRQSAARGPPGRRIGATGFEEGGGASAEGRGLWERGGACEKGRGLG